MADISIYHSFAEVPKRDRVVILGHFDGVHLGHQTLLAVGRRMARQLNLPLMVFTFFPQFQSIKNPEFRYILKQEDKFKLIADLGIDEILTVPFSETISKQSPEDFVHCYLQDALSAQGVVVGFDYSFGYKAKGKAKDLEQLMAPKPVRIIPAFKLGDEVLSSTLIRSFLNNGDICRAEFYLGYDYTLSGTVIHGLANGRRFLVPTANIELPAHVLLPKAGVYAATCQIEGDHTVYSSVVNIGTRPTIDDNPKELVEVHILDFDRDIYGKNIAVKNLHFLRGIVKFDSLKELKDAIFKDISDARQYFKEI